MKLINKLCIAFVALLTSCQKDLMDLTPYDSIGSANMWTTENLADMGVIGIYNVLRSTDVAGLYFVNGKRNS